MDDLHDIVALRAKELYDTCDIEGKGYIIEPEMKRLVSILHLSQDQLETVFHSLDGDADGRLTLQEFTEGFGQFIVGDVKPNCGKRNRHSSVFSTGFEGSEKMGMEFHGAISGSTFPRETASDLYEQLQDQHPHLLPGFENLLSKLSQEIQKSHTNVQKIETTIFRETTKHEENVRNLYSDMESQIKAEEARMLNEEKQREKIIKEEKAQELKNKNRHYQELLLIHDQTKKRLEELRQQTGETQQEIDELAEEKYTLEEALEETQLNLEQSQEILEELRSKANEHRRQRAETIGKISVNITSEKEILLNQLKQLRDINKKLRDERDEGLMYPIITDDPDSPIEDILQVDKNSSGDEAGDLDRPIIQTDIRKIKLADASRLFGKSMSLSVSLDESVSGDDDDDGIEVDEEPPTISEDPTEYKNYSMSETIICGKGRSKIQFREANIQTDEIEDSRKQETSFSLKQRYVFTGEEMPESVFKVVLVGDSNVGKTAILERFVGETFQSIYAPTVGVDFYLRSIIVEGNVIALQVWDTAGQEKFRSITKQYYRKSDGVILVYDIMEQGSFLNIRNWLDVIEKNTDDVILMLLGNKSDLGKLMPQKIPVKNAADLSQAYGALFFEVSAATGENINESFASMAKILKSRQDKEMRAYTNMDVIQTKSGCCGQRSERVLTRSEIINSKRNK